MSVAPAGFHPSPPLGQITERHWRLGALVAFVVLLLVVVGLAVGLNDGSTVRNSGVTTTPTSLVISSSEGLLGTDLGGAYHRRGGNQP